MFLFFVCRRSIDFREQCACLGRCCRRLIMCGPFRKHYRTDPSRRLPLPDLNSTQSGQIETVAQRDQQALLNTRVLPPMAGPTGPGALFDGAEGLVREEHRQSVSAAVRHERLVHCTVRAHDSLATDVQRGGQPWRGLLASRACVGDSACAWPARNLRSIRPLTDRTVILSPLYV